MIYVILESKLIRLINITFRLFYKLVYVFLIHLKKILNQPKISNKRVNRLER